MHVQDAEFYNHCSICFMLLFNFFSISSNTFAQIILFPQKIVCLSLLCFITSDFQSKVIDCGDGIISYIIHSKTLVIFSCPIVFPVCIHPTKCDRTGMAFTNQQNMKFCEQKELHNSIITRQTRGR